MRHGLLAAALLLSVTRLAAAQEDEEEAKPKKAQKAGKGKKAEEGEKTEEGEEPKKGGGMMEGSGKEPSETEGAERGPYAPQSEHKEKKTEETGGNEAPYVPPERKRLNLYGQLLFGFGHTPRIGYEAQHPKSSMVGVEVGGSYDVSKKVSLGLRVPWTHASFDQKFDGTSGVSESAFGNPELYLEYRIAMNPKTELPLHFGVGVPVAQGNPDVTSAESPGLEVAQVNVLADAASGWREPELYAVKRFPIILGIGIRHRERQFEFGGFEKLVFLPNIGDSALSQSAWPRSPAPQAGTVELKSTAIRSVTGIGADYIFLQDPHLYAGLDLWLAWNLVEPILYTSNGGGGAPTAVAFVAEPKVGAKFGAVGPYAGYILPFGGRLTDEGLGGVRVGVTAEF